MLHKLARDVGWRNLPDMTTRVKLMRLVLLPLEQLYAPWLDPTKESNIRELFQMSTPFCVKLLTTCCLPVKNLQMTMARNTYWLDLQIIGIF